MKNIFYLLLVLLFSCKSSKMMNQNNFVVDSLKVNELLIRIDESNKNFIKEEKKSFMNSKYKDDNHYISSLNWYMSDDVKTFDNDLLKKALFEVLNRIKYGNIVEIQVLYMHFSGEMFYDQIAIIVEEKESYSSIMFVFDGFGKMQIKLIPKEKMIFLKEFIENINFSYLNKSYFNNPPQYFFVNNINFQNRNMQTFFKVEMLYSEMEILNNFFFYK
jgi:hypothetical protein